MTVAKNTALPLERLQQERLGFLHPALGLQQRGQAGQRSRDLRVIFTSRSKRALSALPAKGPSSATLIATRRFVDVWTA